MNVDATLEQMFGDFSVEVFAHEGQGFAANFIDEDDVVRGSGFRVDQQTAINVSISEAVERYAFDLSCATKAHHTDEFPSSCGFAAGVKDEHVKMRSLMEGFERWCFSTWIDGKCKLDEVQTDALSPLTRALAVDFDRIIRFEKEFSAEMAGLDFPVTLGVTLGLKGKGVFAGSRVAEKGHDVWEHGMVEAWVNLLNYRKNPRYEANDKLDLIERRVKYFAEHGDEALAQVAAATKAEWPKAKILYHSKVEEAPLPFLVYRTIYADHISWGVGPDDRFVY